MTQIEVFEVLPNSAKVQKFFDCGVDQAQIWTETENLENLESVSFDICNATSTTTNIPSINFAKFQLF